MLFLMICDPSPVTNCHKSWTPPPKKKKVCHTSWTPPPIRIRQYYVIITDDYEKFLKQFYNKIYEILGRAFCIFPTFLCRVDLVSNLQILSCLLEGATQSL